MPESSELGICVRIDSIMKNSCFSGIENEYVKSASLHNTQLTHTDGMILIACMTYSAGKLNFKSTSIFEYVCMYGCVSVLCVFSTSNNSFILYQVSITSLTSQFE